jgi:hypothetical protein
VTYALRNALFAAARHRTVSSAKGVDGRRWWAAGGRNRAVRLKISAKIVTLNGRVPRIPEQKEVLIMSPVLIAVLALATPPSEGEQETPSPPAVVSPEKAVVAPRKGAELRDAVRAALRRWAKASDAQADAAAREFLGLYEELQSDDQLSRSQRQYFSQRVRIRLMQLSDQITLRVARQRRLAKAGKAAGGESTRAKADSMETSERATGGRRDDYLSPLAEPARGGGAMRMPDHGEQLVELIQTVIRPETWDVNGGTGSIYYWYPGRALVIRQMDEVHEEIADVLGQLRRAGR